MSIADKEGVYLLCSSDAFGKRIYKVGRSDNLRQRLCSYPPNWCLLDCLPCEHSPDMERKIIKCFKSNFKIYDRHEYFEIDAEFHEIKFFFNKMIYEERTQTPKPVAPKPVAPKPVAPKPRPPTQVPVPLAPKYHQLLNEIRAEQLDTFNFVMTRKDIEDNAKSFNRLVDVILENKTKGQDEQKKLIAKALEDVISKKRAKQVAEDIMKEGVDKVTDKTKITNKEIEKLFK